MQSIRGLTMRLSVCLVILFFTVGCVPPRVIVTPNPCADTKGIRYYRPKPYLLILPFSEVTTTTDPRAKSAPADETTQKKTTVELSKINDEFVTMQLEYLPDFSEEYAIDVKSGFGINETSFRLENGWKLTEINQKLDSQTDENIKAVGELISSASKALAKSSPDNTVKGNEALGNQPIRARNIPYGYYESVIGKGPDGRKRLFGWRYVGFVPYASCPIDACGSESMCCNQTGDVYGIIFEDGIMVFKELNAVRNVTPCNAECPTGNNVHTEQQAPLPPTTPRVRWCV